MASVYSSHHEAAFLSGQYGSPCDAPQTSFIIPKWSFPLQDRESNPNDNNYNLVSIINHEYKEGQTIQVQLIQYRLDLVRRYL